jgi:hypothetical protein
VFPILTSPRESRGPRQKVAGLQGKRTVRRVGGEAVEGAAD